MGACSAVLLLTTHIRGICELCGPILVCLGAEVLSFSTTSRHTEMNIQEVTQWGTSSRFGETNMSSSPSPKADQCESDPRSFASLATTPYETASEMILSSSMQSPADITRFTGLHRCASQRNLLSPSNTSPVLWTPLTSKCKNSNVTLY